MPSTLTLTFLSTLFLTTAFSTVSAKQCAVFDTSSNLYLFGGTEDVGLGGNSTWGSPSATTLTTTGRPPWTGNNTACFLSQYNNAMYVLDADSSSPSSIYVFNFGTLSWSTQTTSGAPDLTTGSAVLDHDTNVFFSLNEAGTLYQLDFSTVTTAATGSSLAWEAALNPSFTTTGYNPVMAEASNHILFFDVPSVAAGSADLFVIHYSYFQPTSQAFNLTNGATTNFPDTHGRAIGIPYASNDAGDQVVFVPDDFSNTYVVTHWTSASTVGQTSDAPAGLLPYINTTQTLPAPTSQDVNAAYASSDTNLVQLDSTGAVYYISSAYGNGWAVSTSASWTKMDYTFAGLTGTTTTSSVASSGSSSSTGTAASSTGTAAASTSAATGSTSKTSTGTASASAAAATTSAASGASQAVTRLGRDGLFAGAGIACLLGAASMLLL